MNKKQKEYLTTRGRGRPKGSLNKVPAQAREMILAALEQAGGVAYLVECANDPRTRAAFLALVGKTLPLKADVQGGLSITIVSEFDG